MFGILNRNDPDPELEMIRILLQDPDPEIELIRILSLKRIWILSLKKMRILETDLKSEKNLSCDFLDVSVKKDDKLHIVIQRLINWQELRPVD